MLKDLRELKDLFLLRLAKSKLALHVLDNGFALDLKFILISPKLRNLCISGKEKIMNAIKKKNISKLKHLLFKGTVIVSNYLQEIRCSLSQAGYLSN